jgi:aspartate aminotransferase
MQQYSTLAPETLGQFALVRFLNENMKESYIKNTILRQYLRKRDLMATLLDKNLPLAKTAKPQGAFYFFVDMRPYLSKLNVNEEDFASRLLKQTGVAVIPGRFFGENGRNHIRLTFVTESDQRIEAGIVKMAEFVSSSQ